MFFIDMLKFDYAGLRFGDVWPIDPKRFGSDPLKSG